MPCAAGKARELSAQGESGCTASLAVETWLVVTAAVSCRPWLQCRQVTLELLLCLCHLASLERAAGRHWNEEALASDRQLIPWEFLIIRQLASSSNDYYHYLYLLCGPLSSHLSSLFSPCELTCRLPPFYLCFMAIKTLPFHHRMACCYRDKQREMASQ